MIGRAYGEWVVPRGPKYTRRYSYYASTDQSMQSIRVDSLGRCHDVLRMQVRPGGAYAPSCRFLILDLAAFISGPCQERLTRARHGRHDAS